MSIKEHRCPKCRRFLQTVDSEHGVLRACRCGHAEDDVDAEQEQRHGIVAYIQDLGRKTITRISEPQN